MADRPCLIIIPGIGDELAIYKTFARRWQRLGYDAHIVPFGWSDTRAALADKMAVFLQRLDELGPEPLYVIGVSAGGTAAINAMAERPNIQKVITICSPLATMPALRNSLLAESIAHTQNYLKAFGPEQLQRILSVYALHDPVVSTRLSRAEGISTLRIPMVFHPAAIFSALMFYAPRLNAFLSR
jgi:pimeloyl-ACP methyl ester carboxylesterase